VLQSPKNCLSVELGTSTADEKPVKLLRSHKKHGENLRSMIDTLVRAGVSENSANEIIAPRNRPGLAVSNKDS